MASLDACAVKGRPFAYGKHLAATAEPEQAVEEHHTAHDESHHTQEAEREEPAPVEHNAPKEDVATIEHEAPEEEATTIE